MINSNSVSRSLAPVVALLFAHLVYAGSAAAHGTEGLAAQTGPHGGALRVAAQYHLELKIDQARVRLWVTDHDGEPQATDGATGRATVVAGGRRIDVVLSPTGRNALLGKHAGLDDARKTRVVVSLSMPGVAPAQARFTMADE